MQTYMQSLAHPNDVKLFQKIHNAVTRLPDDFDFGLDEKNEPIVLSCHILARAVSHVFSVKHEDGYFCFHWQHSWVLGPHLDIVDVYPVAILGGPIMVSGGFGSPHKILYQALPTEAIYGDRFQQKSFLKSVEIVESILRRNL